MVDYGDTCGASLSSKTIGFGRVEAGGRSVAKVQAITANGTLPVEGGVDRRGRLDGGRGRRDRRCNAGQCDERQGGR